MEQLVFKEILDPLDLSDQPELLDQPDPPEFMEILVFKEILAQMGPLV
jgi:hypothetical protein